MAVMKSERFSDAISREMDATVGRQFVRMNKQGGVVRVMAHAEGYLMMRHPGCAPFLVHWRDFRKDFRPMNTVV
jgi:hypothetical protein